MTADGVSGGYRYRLRRLQKAQSKRVSWFSMLNIVHNMFQ